MKVVCFVQMKLIKQCHFGIMDLPTEHVWPEPKGFCSTVHLHSCWAVQELVGISFFAFDFKNTDIKIDYNYLKIKSTTINYIT